MCLLVPGKIINIKGDEATVDYGSEKRTGKILQGKYEKGEYVMIQGGFIIGTVPEKEAIDALKLYNEAIKE